MQKENHLLSYLQRGHVRSPELQLVSWSCLDLCDDQNFATTSSHQTQKPSPTWLVKVSPSVWAARLAKWWVSECKNFHLQSLWWFNLKLFEIHLDSVASYYSRQMAVCISWNFSHDLNHSSQHRFPTSWIASPWITRNLLVSKTNRQLQ